MAFRSRNPASRAFPSRGERRISPPRQTQGRRRPTMPLINVKLIEGVFNEAQKKKMVSDLTDAMVAIEGETMRQVTWVVIEEVKSGNWALGGKPLTTADVRAMQASKAA